MHSLFSIDTVVGQIWGYPLTPVEIIGTLFGLWSVWLAAKARVSNYPVGLVNVVFFFVIFYQVQMYSDMLLQVYFFFVSIFGWYRWTHPSIGEMDANRELKVSTNDPAVNIAWCVSIGVFVVALGYFMSNIHTLLPKLFPMAAAYPYYDAFTTVASIAAMYLMAQKKIESWVLWMIVDLFCVVLYYFKGIRLMSIEYAIFFMIATSGLIRWLKEMRGYDGIGVGKVRSIA